MKVNWDDIIPKINGKIKNVPNHRLQGTFSTDFFGRDQQLDVMLQPKTDGLVEFLHETVAGHTPLRQGTPHRIRGWKHGLHAGSSLKDPTPGFAS